MINQLILVGRLVRDPELIETSNGKKVSNITLAVNRQHKDENGDYITDFIDVALWGNLAEKTSEYCGKGDVIGIKGCIGSDLDELSDGKKFNKIKVMADKITFITTKHKDVVKDDMER